MRKNRPIRLLWKKQPKNRFDNMPFRGKIKLVLADSKSNLFLTAIGFGKSRRNLFFTSPFKG